MERVLFQDVVPYDAPSSLESLRGPERGTLVLPKSVYWGPARLFDLAEPADLVSAYQAILQEGSGSQQETLLNAVLLRRVWSWLTLPRRCRQLWESRFPDLASWESQRPVSEVVAEQRAVARLLLAELGAGGFALAGSGAMREHGLGSRPTEDVDLFTVITNRHRFDAAVEQATARLRTGGYTVTVVRRAPQFARLEVTAPGGIITEVDLGVDWRAGDPVHLELGPVLSLADAVAAKVGALYSRGEARDFLDVDQIRQSGRFSDTQLLKLLAERDPGFDQRLFAEQLARVTHLDPRQVHAYGTTAEELAHIKHRLGTWARHLSESVP